MHGQYILWRLDWPHVLAAISEGREWKTFLMLILSSHGYRGLKKCTPNIVPFCLGWGSLPATCVVLRFKHFFSCKFPYSSFVQNFTIGISFMILKACLKSYHYIWYQKFWLKLGYYIFPSFSLFKINHLPFV